MDKHDNYNLLDYSKTLYESNRHGEPYCRVGVSLDGGELTVWRILKNGNTTAVPELLKARIHWICSTLINFVLHSKNIIPLPSSRR